MAEKEKVNCSFCGNPQSSETPLIVGIDGRICETCVRLANQVVSSWGRRRQVAKPLKKPPIPRQIKDHLDKNV